MSNKEGGKPNIDKWANFLMNEKLDAADLEEKDVLIILRLAEEAGKERSPKIGMHKDKLLSREYLCGKAMDLGIDLMSIKRKGKIAMGRGLLDAWNKLYAKRFGSTVGTSGNKEAVRRDVKTDLCRKGIKGVPRKFGSGE